jgi:hypothetical protein
MSARIVLLLIAITCGCSRDSGKQPAKATPSQAAGFGGRNLPSKPPFELSEVEKLQFIDKLKTLERGDKLSDVMDLLGPPYAVRKITPKRLQSKTERSMNKTSVRYYVLKTSESGFNNDNQGISLLFDSHDRLEGMDTIGNLDVGELSIVNARDTHVDGLNRSEDVRK